MRIRRTHVALATLPVVGYLALLVLVAALYVKPPLLGWIGFGVVGAVGTILAVGATLLFPRMRTNVTPSTAGAAGGGVLVLADARCSTAQLCGSVAAHVRDREVDVHVVAPILATPLHYLSGDERLEREDAQHRLDETLEELRGSGIDATGSLGTDDPLQALSDALVGFPARELVVVTSRDSHWLEHDLLERARRLVPKVEQIVVSPEPVAV